MENKTTKRTNRLGRGLSALIPDISTEIDKKDIITIDLKNIYPNQDQPIRVFDEEKIKILSESIKNYGVLQPIVLKPFFPSSVIQPLIKATGLLYFLDDCTIPKGSLPNSV